MLHIPRSELQVMFEYPSPLRLKLHRMAAARRQKAGAVALSVGQHGRTVIGPVYEKFGATDSTVRLLQRVAGLAIMPKDGATTHAGIVIAHRLVPPGEDPKTYTTPAAAQLRLFAEQDPRTLGGSLVRTENDEAALTLFAPRESGVGQTVHHPDMLRTIGPNDTADTLQQKMEQAGLVASELRFELSAMVFISPPDTLDALSQFYG